MARSSVRFTNSDKPVSKTAKASPVKNHSASGSIKPKKVAAGKTYVSLAKEIKPEKIQGYTYAF